MGQALTSRTAPLNGQSTMKHTSQKKKSSMLPNRHLENIFERESSAEEASQETIGDFVTNDSLDLHFYMQAMTNDSEEETDVPSCSPSSSQQPSYFPHSTSVVPTTAPSQSPSFSPSKQPSYLPSKHPSAAPSGAPSQTPTKQSIPSFEPSASPTTVPSTEPSAGPSTSPTAEHSLEPPSIPSDPPQQPTLAPTEAVLRSIPFPSYYATITLETSRRRAGEVLDRLLLLDQERLKNELGVVLPDYMTLGLNDDFGGLLVKFLGVDVIIEPADGTSQRRHLRFDAYTRTKFKGLRGSGGRSLQETEEATFLVLGNATFSDFGANEVTEEYLTLETDGAVQSLLHESNAQEAVNFLQDHPESDLLQNTVGFSASVQRAPATGIEKDTNHKPSIVSIIFGILLVLLAAVMLVAHIYILRKKLVKRSAKLKQKRKSSQSQASSDTRRTSPGRTIPSVGSSRVAPTTISSANTGSVSSRPAAHPHFFVTKSWSGEDTIARELKKAASFDRKASQEHQHSHQVRVEEKRAVAAVPRQEPSSKPNFLQPTKRDTAPDYYNAWYPQSGEERRATLFGPPPSEGPVDPWTWNSVMCDKHTEPLLHTDRNSDYLPSSSDSGDSSITESDSEEDECVMSFKRDLPSTSPQSLVLLSKKTHLQTSPQQQSVSKSSEAISVNPHPYSLTTQYWNQPPVTPYSHTNLGIVSMDPPRRTQEDSSTDRESLLELVHEVQILSRFMKGYEKRRWRKRRKGTKEEGLLGATKRSTDRSLLDVEYNLLDDHASGTCHRSTQTVGCDTTEDSSGDDGSVSEDISAIVSSWDTESSTSRHARLGIVPRMLPLVDPSIDGPAGHHLESPLLDVKELFKHRETDLLSSVQRSNESSSIGESSNMLPVSPGSSAVLQWPSPSSQGCQRSPPPPPPPPPLPRHPRQQLKNFGSMVDDCNSKRLSESLSPLPPPPPAPTQVGKVITTYESKTKDGIIPTKEPWTNK